MSRDFDNSAVGLDAEKVLKMTFDQQTVELENYVNVTMVVVNSLLLLPQPSRFSFK